MADTGNAARRAPGLRERNRRAIEAELLAVARLHLAEHGAAALSLRAVARDLGMSPSAVFRYVSDREELLTRLIVAAYDDLGEVVEAADAAVEREDLRGRWWALARSVRGWALEHPHEYALLYGSPVPHYHAPAERTTPAGTRITAVLLRLGADSAGATRPAADTAAEQRARRAVSGLLTDPGFPGTVLPARVLADGITAWALLRGGISSEIFGQLGPGTGDPGALFDHLVAAGERLLFG